MPSRQQVIRYQAAHYVGITPQINKFSTPASHTLVCGGRHNREAMALLAVTTDGFERTRHRSTVSEQKLILGMKTRKTENDKNMIPGQNHRCHSSQKRENGKLEHDAQERKTALVPTDGDTCMSW